jgi:hypothetical protein
MSIGDCLKKCKIKGCDGKVAVFKHGLCWPHMQRYYRHGDVGNLPLRKHKIRKPFVIKPSDREII